MKNRHIGPQLLALLHLLLFAGWLHAAPARIGETPVLPELTTVNGKRLQPADWRGKVVVISYFSTTCPFCMNEAPQLQKLSRENPDNVVVLTVDVDHKDPQQRGNVQQWIKKYQLTHPVTTDFARLEPVLGKPKGLPINYIFDRAGKLSRIEVGEMLDEDFDDIARYARSAPKK